MSRIEIRPRQEGEEELDQETLRRLEFDKVIFLLQQQVSFSLAGEAAADLLPSSLLEEVQADLAVTDEAYRLLSRRGEPELHQVWDIRSALQRSSLGSVLSASQLLEVALTVRTSRRVKQWFARVGEEVDMPFLLQLTGGMADLREEEGEIFHCIDEQGELKDEASETLAALRREKGGLERRIKERLEGMIRSPYYLKMLQEPIITQRSNHYVLSVKAPYRSTFGGVVHDQSASGATLFIEPESVASDARRIQEVSVQERKEMERILTRLSAMVGSKATEIEENLHRLTKVDLHLAKGRLARSMGAVRPEINGQGRVRLKQARHPLLPRETAVPVNLTLGADFSTLVITGPNTGGKTVTLKTLGLLSCMAMSGLFVPATEGTELAVFNGIYADIGDEQSIEQSLSTFSSHMKNVVQILQEADGNSLLLLDELGAGTDPQEGAALAIALLDEVHGRGCRVVATTHYSELKAYAYNRLGVSNASVEFDVETLQPTYRLLIGIPGHSNAFAIAKRLGLPQELLQKAQQHLTAETREVEKMVSSLLLEKKEAEAERDAVSQLRQRLQEQKQEWSDRLERLEKEKEKVLREEQERYRRETESQRRRMVQLIGELEQRLREEQLIKPHEVTQARKRTDELEWNTRVATVPPRTKKGKDRRPLSLEPGEDVFVPRFNQKGTVLEVLEKDRCLVQIGAMKLTLTVEDVEEVAQSSKQQKEPIRAAATTPPALAKARMELDLRGQRVEEALEEVEKFLDDALLAGLRQITIIHGMGTGALRRSVQEHLRSHRHVQEFRLGGQGEGGLGVTVVQMR